MLMRAGLEKHFRSLRGARSVFIVDLRDCSLFVCQDLIHSSATAHASCMRGFVRIKLLYETGRKI